MYINICVPCFNESNRLSLFLNQIQELSNLNTFQDHSIDFTFLNDGSLHDESQKMNSIITTFKSTRFNISMINFDSNRGKGAVLRDGFQVAINKNCYDIIGFMDGDGATGALELQNLILNFEKNKDLDLVIGSRWKALGYKVERTLKRHLMGRIFATLLSVIFDIPVYDSQCGAKLFKATVLNNKLLTYCYDNKWLFDTQLLITLYLSKKKIIEQPVNWKDQPGSKVHILRDSWRMFVGLITFKKYSENNKYE